MKRKIGENEEKNEGERQGKKKKKKKGERKVNWHWVSGWVPQTIEKY